MSSGSSRKASVSVSIGVCVIGWIAGWFLLGRPRRLPDHSATTTGLHGCSIVIPARDEATSIGSLLDGLTRSDGSVPGPDRIIVVDDGSTDATAAIAAGYPQVQVVQAAALPEGWTGKSWACHSGVEVVGQQRPDDTLVFLDADVRLDRAALARVVAERDLRGGLVSVQPWHETERPYEQLSALFNVVAVMGTAANSRRGTNGAFGPVLVSRRSEYDLVGGHRAVRAEVVEDLALAGRYRDAGLPVSTFQGESSIRFRMYPDGIRQLAEGWTKNFAAGAGSTHLVRLAAIVLWVTAAGSAALGPYEALTNGTTPLVAAALYGAFALQLGLMFRQVGSFGAVTALLFPTVLIFFMAVFVRSLYCTHIRHSVEWRGRSISTAPPRS